MSKNKKALDTILNSARDGRIEDIKEYLSQKKNINASGPDGRTLLINAAANHHSALVKLLLVAGADVSVATNSGKTVLNYALFSSFSYSVGGKKGDSSALETVKLLLNQRCSVSAVDISFGILFHDSSVLNLLLKRVSQNKKILIDAIDYATKEAFEYADDEIRYEKNLGLVRACLKTAKK